MLLNNKVYITYDFKFPKEAVLRCSRTDYIKSWISLSLPDIKWFSLATYRSQLVLVGGWNIHNGKVLNELWVSDTGTNWQKSLPSMPTHRYGVATTSSRSSQHLVVAGGYGGNGIRILDKVEVLSEGEWTSLQPIPSPQSRLSLTFHNGNLFVNAHRDRVHYCKLESMLATCKSKEKGGSGLWKTLSTPFSYAALVSLGAQLVAVGDRLDEIYAFSTLAQSWFQVGDVVDKVIQCIRSITATPKGQLLVICGSKGMLIKTKGMFAREVVGEVLCEI